MTKDMTQKLEKLLWEGRKHCGKRRKCWLPAFSPFPLMFSKGYFLRVVKNQNCDKELFLYNTILQVQRFSEKALVLQDECLSKGTCPALISTRQFSNQFILKESQNTDFFALILVDY